VCDAAAESDALSTAWMCLSTEEIEEVCAGRLRTGAILQAEADSPDLVVIGFAHKALKGG
jgi:thiamine biosynthesis lipoprotein ApbE